MSKRRAYTDGMPVPFVDIAITMAMIFLLMFAITPKSPPKKATTEAPIPKAEFLVEMSWPDGSQNDMDLYVRDPSGGIVFFQNRRTASMFLDNDNTGTGNTVVTEDGVSKEIPTRIEIVTIRSLLPGEYTVNVHEYRQRSSVSEKVRVRIIKLNPYNMLYDSSYEFDTQGQERTFANFSVDGSGTITGVYVIPTKLVGAK